MNKGKKYKEQKKKNAFYSKVEKWTILSVLFIVAGFILYPWVLHWNCKIQCLKTFKGPYPEIACKYQCPSPLQGKSGQ